MTNKSFVDMMGNEAASSREPWVKVRWINIGGISWDVISALALKYDIHPLALEDVLHQRGHHRSKADYYQKHLFLRVLSHTIAAEDDLAPSAQPDGMHPLAPPCAPTMTGVTRSSSPVPMSDLDKYDKDRDGVIDLDASGKVEDEEKTIFGSAPGSRFSTRRGAGGILKKRPFFGSGQGDEEGAGTFMNRFTSALQSRKEKQTNIISIEELKRGERVNVKVSPMFIFLFRDGTVISIHPTPNLEFTSPIGARLRQRDTGLRTSADPSLLVQSLLDLIVDQALEVVDDYHGKILKLEHDILLKPKITTVRHLHILSGDLILRKRTLEPIKTLVYGLRRYDVDRCAALVDMSNAPPGTKIEGFMSHKSKIYLADVHDHMEYILTSLDMFSGISENLINYTFNITSYEMNDFMRYLTLATIIFLPLTLLTGYFGMNFDNMWTVHHDHSDVIFWIIAIPLMCILIPFFAHGDIIKMIHYVQKRMRTKEAVKTFKQA
jgi:Mg2+ and Co2+ transporter CorA